MPNKGGNITRRRVSGFSLLEMVVATAILGISLAVLYQIVGSATRIVGSDEKYAYGVELARSLLADNGVIPAGGVSSNGETAGGYRWQVSSEPVPLPAEGVVAMGALHYIETTVSWVDGGKTREVALHSVVQGIESQ